MAIDVDEIMRRHHAGECVAEIARAMLLRASTVHDVIVAEWARGKQGAHHGRRDGAE